MGKTRPVTQFPDTLNESFCFKKPQKMGKNREI